MRKIIFLAVMLLCVNWLQAQFNTVKITPKTYTAEDEITFTIDLTGTSLEGKTDLYIWIWANDGATGFTKVDGVTNGGSFGASKPEAKMTNKGNNIFEYKFLPTTMFGLEPGKLNHWQFLVKTLDGVSKTNDSPKLLFEPIVFTPVPFRVFPNRLGASDVATLYFHQDLALTTAEQRMTPKTVTVTLYDQGGIKIGEAKTWNLKSEGNKVWSYSFISNIAWSIPAGKTASKFSFHFDGTGKDVNGNTVNITTPETEKNIDALK
jgi:hypothetical protein